MTATDSNTGTARSVVRQPKSEIQYDPESSGGLALTIVRGVANAANVDPLALDQRLYDAVDPDAIERMFARFGRPETTTGRIEFEFCEHVVVVHSDGWIEIYD